MRETVLRFHDIRRDKVPRIFQQNICEAEMNNFPSLFCFSGWKVKLLENKYQTFKVTYM